MPTEECPLRTDCHTQLPFANLGRKPVIAAFDGGKITSDAGVLLLQEIERRVGLVRAVSACLHDPRDPRKVRHDQYTLLLQRTFAIALGYEDANDHNTLRADPALKIATGRTPDSAPDLASQPTLCRLENRITRKELVRVAQLLVDSYIAAHPGPRRLIVIDIDSTDDPAHGRQQLALFHGFYGQYMFHPLLVFDGLTGYPLAAVLRSGRSHASKGAAHILRRILPRLKKAYPEAHILVRADSGFAIPDFYRTLERLDVSYTIGLIPNPRLRDRVSSLVEQARQAYEATGEKQRTFQAFSYQADSWERPRRVVAKVEYLPQGPNTRFVVTNVHYLAPQRVYDDLYIGRGETENRIKELKLHLKADRTSCHRFEANQFRFLLHTVAYVLLWHVRQAAAGTQLATASMDTLRLRLLKVGARVKESVRRVVVHCSSSYPYKALLRTIVANLARLEQQPLPLRV